MDTEEPEETEFDRGITLIARIAIGVCIGITLARLFEMSIAGIAYLIYTTLIK